MDGDDYLPDILDDDEYIRGLLSGVSSDADDS